MFKIQWNADWTYMTIKRCRRTGEIFLWRSAPRDWEGYGVPIFHVEDGLIGM